MKIKPLLGILAASLIMAGANAQTVSTVQPMTELIEPYGVAIELSENTYYFTDSARHRVLAFVQKPEPRVVLVATFYDSSPEDLASGGSPEGIVLARGGLVVSDSFKHRIYFMSYGGGLRLLAGNGRGYADGPGNVAKFDTPSGLAADESGNIYIADLKNNVVRRLDVNNNVTTYAAGFNEPAAVAVGDRNEVYVADTRNNAVKVIEPGGAIDTVLLSSLKGPRGLLWVGGATGLLVSDSGNHRIIGVRGTYYDAGFDAGSPVRNGFADGRGTSARFNTPMGLARSREGSVIVADLYNYALREIKPPETTKLKLIPDGGSFSNAVSITVTSATPSAVFTFTTDGKDPTPLSPRTGSPLSFDRGVFGTAEIPLQVRAFAPDFTSSAIISNTVKFFVNPLGLDPKPGTFTNDIFLQVDTLTSKRVIHFNQGNAPPTTNSLVWTDRVYGTSGPLQLRAYRDGFEASELSSNVFNFVVANPTIKPAGGVYANAVLITIANETLATDFRYNLDENAPTLSSRSYSAPFVLDANTPGGSNTVLTTMGFKTGYTSSSAVSQSYSFVVDTPKVSRLGGTFDNNVDLKISTATSSAVLRFTTDGSFPTSVSDEWKDGSFGKGGLLQVVGFRNGFVPSALVSNQFTFVVGNPTIKPAGGTFNNAITVSITNVTAGADLYYTLDGLIPDTTSDKYSNRFVLATNALGSNSVLTVIGIKDGYSNSSPASATYAFVVGTPTISKPGGVFTNATDVNITTATTNATLHFTTNGTLPTESSPQWQNGLYGTDGLLQVRAFRPGFEPSAVISNLFTFVVDKPVVRPPGGVYFNPVIIAITNRTSGSELRYTLDDRDPGQFGVRYTGPFELASNEAGTNSILKVVGYRTGFTNSEPVIQNYSFVVATPSINVRGGTFANSVDVKIATATTNAVLRYTTNGEIPTSSSDIWTNGLYGTYGPLQVRGFRNGFEPSEVVSNSFNFFVANPDIRPAGGIYNNGITVTVSNLTLNSAFHYTFDGRLPTTGSPSITSTNGTNFLGRVFNQGSFQLATNANVTALETNSVLTVIGFREGFTNSTFVSQTYRFVVATPTINVRGGSFANNVEVKIATATTNAVLRYTTNGEIPTTESAIWTNGFWGTHGTFQVRGFLAGFEPSEVVSSFFNFAVTNPEVSPPGGIYNNGITVTVSNLTLNTAFHYTLDGRLPTTENEKIASANGTNIFGRVFNKGSFPLATNSNETASEANSILTVIGFREGYTNSSFVSQTYRFVVATPAINVRGGTFANNVSVSIDTATTNAILHYTTNGDVPTTAHPVWTNGTYGTHGPLQVRGFRPGFEPSAAVSNFFNFVVTNPEISPAGGTYNNAISLNVSNLTLNTAFHYTLDGRLPTTESAKINSANGTNIFGRFFNQGLFPLATNANAAASENNSILTVIGFREGYTNSAFVSQTYRFVVATPTINFRGGSFANDLEVKIETATTNASLHYTTNGDLPTTAHPVWTNGIYGTHGPLQVRGFRPGFEPSTVVSNFFNFAVTNPEINPSGGTYNNGITVTVSNLTLNTAFRYTLDGRLPTTGSPSVSSTNGTNSFTGQIFSQGSFQLASNENIPETNSILNVIGFKAGYTNSVLASQTYRFVVATPTINVRGGSFANNVEVKIETATTNASIHYTTNGDLPTTAHPVWTNGIWGTYGPLQVRGFRTGFEPSAVVSNFFDFAVADLEVSPPGGTFNNGITVTVSNLTLNTEFRYTLNGRLPTPDIPPLTSINGTNSLGRVFSQGSFLLATNENTTALATNSILTVTGFKTGYTNSAPVTQTYEFVVATPRITLAGGTLTNNVDVNITTATTNAVLRYTIDGTEPTTSSDLWTNGSWGKIGPLRVRGFRSGFSPSVVISNFFEFVVGTPSISPTGGVYGDKISITLSNGTAGSALRYTLDGTTPTTASRLYTNAFDLATNERGTNSILTVVGFKDGYTNSLAVSQTYEFLAGTPGISPDSGLFTNIVRVTITNSTPASELRYTVNGSEPSVSSEPYLAPFDIVTNSILKVGAFRSGFVTSAVVSNDYRIKVDRPTMNPSSGFFPNGATVTFSVVRTNANIHYTLDGRDPTTADTLYTGPFIVDQVANPGSDLRILKARAFAPNTVPSDIVSGQPVQTNAIGFPRDATAGIGSTIILPLVVNLSTNDELRSLQFRVQLAPASPAVPAIAGNLRLLSISSNDFIQVTGPAGTPSFSTGAYRLGTTNGLGVAAIGTNASLQVRDFATIAMIAVAIPTNANAGDTYKLEILEPSGTSDGLQKAVPLRALPGRTITISNLSYLVGDSSIGTWYNAGDFGDGNLGNSDVNNAFYASLGVRVPYPFTDVFDAMDTFPDDTAAAAGGDGQIRFLDWQRILRRSLRLDSQNFSRSWSAGGNRVSRSTLLTGSPNTPAQSFTLATINGDFWMSQARLAGLTIENVNPGESVDVPVYVKVATGFKLAGMGFRATITPNGKAPAIQNGLRFIPASNRFIPLQALGLSPDVLLCGWSEFSPALQGNTLLGYVRLAIPDQARAGQSYALSFSFVNGTSDGNADADYESTTSGIWVQSVSPEAPEILSDQWKVHFFGSLTDPSAKADADPDHDGMSNTKEFLAGTNPTDPASYLKLNVAEWNEAKQGVRMSWQTVPGRVYVLESSPDLSQWKILGENLPGDGQVREHIDANPMNQVQFYRLRVQP